MNALVTIAGDAKQAEHYTTPLSLTSQFFFCGLPLRLDSYRGCAFQCSFCYARYRGGNTPSSDIVPAEGNTLRRTFKRAFSDETEPGVIGQFLRHRVPIHFGGMSDPFQPVESRFGVTRQFLETLRDFSYPTVISTRSTEAASEPILALLAEMRFVVVQFSFVSTRPDVANRLQPHSPSPKRLLRAMEKLASRGLAVTCRWQPYVPGISEPAREFVRRTSEAGASHIALEHLKLPVEKRHPLWPVLTAGAGMDLEAYYRSAGARLDGRERVLPAETKVPAILAARTAAHEYGLSFGAADNEFQYLSDYGCCCSGVDRFPGFDGWFKHQFAHAVRLCRGERIVYGAIARYWTPNGSVDRWMNSHSRIDDGEGSGMLEEHICNRWNQPTSALGPGSFYGVELTNEFTPSGFRVYQWNESGRWLLKLIGTHN
jgi:DNA repair photolyase